MNNNNYNFTFDYASPQEGDKQDIKNNIVCGGEKIKILQDYKRHLGVQHQRQNTVDRYYNSALHFIRHSKGVITKESIDDYICHLNLTKKRNTVASEITGLNLYLKYCKQHTLCRTIPKWEDTHRDTITKEEIQQFIKYARANCHLMDYLIVLFITDLDCRPHEIAKAQWKWICGNKIYLSDCKTGNTYSYLTEELITNLSIWKEKQQPKNRYIFTNYQGSYKGQPITVHTQKIRALIQRLGHKVVGRKINPQDLRASVITAEFNEYINPKVIQRKARHRSFKSTMKYNHVDDLQLLDYLNTGTIFNNETLFKRKTQNTPDNGSYINTLLPQETIKDEMDNNNYSFSISLFNQTFFDTILDVGVFHLLTGSYKFSPVFKNTVSGVFLPTSASLTNIGGNRF